MSILYPSDNLDPTVDSPITWRQVHAGLWVGHTPAAIDYNIERGRGLATYRVWESMNGLAEPLKAFETTAEAAAYAAERYLSLT